VHEGFKNALNVVWPKPVNILKPLADRPVWITGHSLGAALATLAADRVTRERASSQLGELKGIYTFGSPLVGDRQFVDGFNTRCADRSFRFVNDQDTVTRLPPRLLGYRHVNTERIVGFDDPDTSFREPVIDHTPRRYAVLIWNALVDAVGV
jgi:triacylglycerol lipase